MSNQLVTLLRESLPAGYEIDEPLGAGGQGAVFSGKRLGARVALKFFSSADPERLRREVEELGGTELPGIPRIIDCHIVKVEGQPVPLVVYEFIDGRSLRTQLDETGGALAQGDVAQVGHNIGMAVEALWARRVVHRDIKPANIVRRQTGDCVLVDLGFAQHLSLPTITHPAGQPGTVGYRSPEQCGGRRRLTVHSDIFSLGVTLFECAAGRHPWDRNQVAMNRVSPRRLLDLRPDIDPVFARLIHAMLSRSPARRPASVSSQFARFGEM